MAKEYIEREAALSAQNKSMNLDECRKRLERLPAADVAEVVRCKDCKYGVPTKNGFLDDMIACEDKDSPCGYSSWLCQLDWFCADGERREAQHGR